MSQAARGGRILYAAPELVAAAVGGFSIGPMVLLVAGHFSAGVGVPLGLAGAAIACWLCGAPDEDASRRDLWLAVAAAAVVVAWFAYNVRYAAEDLYATRDPATYTSSGRWLVDHSSLQIHTTPDIFGRPSGGNVASGSQLDSAKQSGAVAYALVDDGVLNAQGVHLLPVLLGLSGSAFGVSALLATNTAITALALFVFFGLARRVVGSTWALAALVAFAVSMPIIYVGRDSYTESLTLLFLMGALAFVHRAYRANHVGNWALAGLLGGLSTCARVDSYGALIGLVAGGVVLVGVAAEGERRRAVLCAGAMAAGAAGPVLLGWLDLVHLSRQYYHAQHGYVTSLLLLLVLLVLFSPVAVWIAWRAGVRRWFASERATHRLAVGANALLVLAFAFLVTRPIWQKTHGPLQVDLENMQRRWHKPVDGTRTYNELTVHWVAQYYGVVTVLLALGGYALLLARLLRRRDHALTATLVMGLSMSALYLYRVQAAPDQPWAMRRYVPVVLPLLLTAAAVALRWVWSLDKWRPWLRQLTVAAAVVFIAFPAYVAWPMRSVSEEDGQRRQLDDICTAVGKDGAVVEVDEGTIFGYGQSIRSFCNVPTIGLLDPTSAQIVQVNSAVRAHNRTLFLIGQSYEHTGGQKGQAFSVVNVERWPTQINEPPDERDSQQYAIWLSEVDLQGTPHPVAPLRSGS